MGSTTESGARDAFLLLIALAHADRITNRPETVALESFQRHLGIPAKKARQYRRLARKLNPTLPTDDRTKGDLMAMLIGVAWADGALCEREQAWLAELATSLNLSATSFAHLLHVGEERARRRQTQHQKVVVGSVVAVFLSVACVLYVWQELAPRGDEMLRFKEMAEDYQSSTLLIRTEYALAHPDGRTARSSSTGTGFFIHEDGLAATNKHVIQPWKFGGGVQNYIADGYVVDERSVRIQAWIGGTPFRRQDGTLSADNAFDTRDGSLQVMALPVDRMLIRQLTPTSQVPEHASNNGDLALVQCQVSNPVTPLPMARKDDVSPLDPVMVIGFPRGTRLLEGVTAESSPVVGRVRKAEDSIYITAPIVSGNSGGPLIDENGRVIGVATRISGDATVGCCIRVQHLRALLP